MTNTPNFIAGTPEITSANGKVSVKVNWGSDVTVSQKLTVALIHDFDVKTTISNITGLNPDNPHYSAAFPTQWNNTMRTSVKGELSFELSVDWLEVKAKMDEYIAQGAEGIAYNADGTVPYYVVFYDEGVRQAFFPVNIGPAAGSLIPLPKYVTGWTENSDDGDTDNCAYIREVYIRNPVPGSSITVKRVEVPAADGAKVAYIKREGTGDNSTDTWTLSSTEQTKYTIPGGETSKTPLFKIAWEGADRTATTFTYKIIYTDGVSTVEREEEVFLYLDVNALTTNRIGELTIDPEEYTFRDRTEHAFTLTNTASATSGTTAQKGYQKVTTGNIYSAETQKGLPALFEATSGPYLFGDPSTSKTEYMPIKDNADEKGTLNIAPTAIAKKGDWSYVYVDYTTGQNNATHATASVLVRYEPAATYEIRYTTGAANRSPLSTSVGNMPASDTKAEGEIHTVSSNVPTAPEGWTFDHWEDVAVPGSNYKAGNKITVGVEDITLRAVWKAKVTAEVAASGGGKIGLRGGAATATPQTYDVLLDGSTINISLKAIPDAGHSFSSWSTTTGLANSLAETYINSVTGPITYTASFTASGVKVFVKVDGDVAGGKQVYLVKHTAENTWPGATNTETTATDTGAAVFEAVPNDTYDIYVDGVDTGKDITVDDEHQEPEITLEYYTVKLATSIANGTATVTYDKGGTGAANVTSAGKVILLGDMTVFTLNASPDTNFTFGWTARVENTTTDVGTVQNSTQDPATWFLPANYSGKGPIVLAPNFARGGVSMVLTVNLDSVAKSGLDVRVKDARNQVVGTTQTTDSNGQVTYNGLTGGATYTAEVITTDYSGVYTFTTPTDKDGAATLDYYTVTVVNGTGSLNAAAAATHVLAGTTTTLTSGPDYTHGYGKSGAWTLGPNPEQTTGDPPSNIGAASALSGSGTGITDTITVNGKVTATANYEANTININIYKNGVLDTATDRKVSLKKATTDTDYVGSGSGKASKQTGSTGKVSFSPVDSDVATSTSEETYYIYVGDVYTGHTVKCTPGYTANKDLYYYDVSFADAQDGTEHGHYANGSGTEVAKPAKTEVLVGGTKNSVNLPVVKAANANYDHTGWTMTPPTATLTGDPGDFKDASGNTVTDSTSATTGTVTATKWQIKDNYTANTTGLTPKGILLTPVFRENGKYSATITVNLNDHAVADEATVTLTQGETTKTATTTDGIATFVGLSGAYTVSVSGEDEGGTVVTFHSAASGDGSIAQITKDAANPTLDFYQLTLTAGAHGSVNTTLNGVYYDQYPLSPKATATAGYHFVNWTVEDASGSEVPVHGKQETVTGFKIGAETKWFANFAPNTTSVNSYKVTGTYGSTSFTSNAPAPGNSGTTVTAATMNATGVANEKFTYSEVTLPDGWPGGLTISWGSATETTVDGKTTYPGGTGTVTISGKPQDVTAAADLTVTFKAQSSNGGAAVPGSFTLVVNPHPVTPTVDYASGKNKDNTFVGEAIATSAALAVPSSPYFVGVGTTGADAQGWIDLETTDIGTNLTLAWTNKDVAGSTVLTDTTTNLRGTVTYTGANASNVPALDRVWAHPYGDGPLEATRTVSVTVQVRLNGSAENADLRDGAAVKLTRTDPATPAFVTGTGHTILAATHASDAMLVPTGTYTVEVTYTVGEGESETTKTDKRTTVTVGSTGGTIFFDYYDVNYATLDADTDHLLYGTGASTSTDATKALVLVDAAADSATKTTVTLPSVTGQGNYALKEWTQEKPTASAGTFADATTDGSNWSITSGYHMDLTSQDPVGITLKPTAKTTGTTRKVTIRVDGAVDNAATPLSGVTKVELWSKGTTPAKVYETTDGGPHTLVKGVATFENITAGTYEIRVSNGTLVPSGVDLVTATGDAFVDFYKVQFTSPAVQKHYDAWSDTIKGDKAVTAKATVFGVADTALNRGDAVLKGTDVTFTVAAWAPADYALSWAGTGVTAGSTANPLTVAVTQKMTSPVTATLTQNVYPVTGKTDKTAGGNFTDVSGVQYIVTQTGGDDTTLATLKMPTSISYNTTDGQFTTVATALTGSAGKLPAGFIYTLSANSSDWNQTLITGYKVDSGAATTYPATVSFEVTAGADAQPVPWIILDGAEFSFRLDHEDVDPVQKDVSGYTWRPAVNWGYTQATDAPIKTVTIVNTGNRPLTNVKVVAKTPADGANFVLGPIVNSDGDTVDTIPVGGKATFTVRPIADLSAGDYSQVYTVSTTKVQPGKDYTVNLTVNKVPMDYATLTLDPPKEDQHPTANIAGKTDEYKEYYTDSVVWHDVTGGGDTVMEATDKFEASHEYQAVVTLTPNADHYFVDEGSLPDHEDKKYTINTAWYGGPEGSYGGSMVDLDVNADGTVTLVYKFKALQAGTPVPSLEQVSYKEGKLTKITVKSDNAANIYYVLVPSDVVLTDANAQAIKDVASGTSTTLPGSVTPIIFGKTDSAISSTGGTVTWNVNEEFPGDPGKTYTAYAVADIGGTLTGVGRSSVTLPKKLTVTITNDSPDGGTVTKVDGTYPSINGTTGTLALNGTAGNRSEILSITGTADFTVTPGNLTGSEVDNAQAWAVQKIVNKRTSDEGGTVTEVLTKVPPIKYLALTNVTEIDVTFRQRIHGKPAITGTAGLGNSLTVTKGAAVIGTSTEVVLSGDGKNVSIQWQYHPVSETDPNAWTNIPTTGTAGTSTATTDTLTIPNDSTYAGAGFRVVLTYDKAVDAALDGENNPTIFSSVTQTVAATTSNLETPEPKLYKVEIGSGDATPTGVTLADKDKGGLYLLFEPSASETVAKATYKVTLTGGAIPAATPLTVTIDPGTPSTEWTKVNVDLGGGAKNYYAVRWLANWDNVRPGNNGTSSYSDFTARVQALTDLPGWNDSPITGNNGKSNTSEAGRRVLKQTDLEGSFTDRVFNGSAQTGIGASNATTTSDPVTGQIKTIADLFQRDGGTQKGAAVGTIHIQYADKADKTAIADTKTHVNITEATTTPPDVWDPTNKHDYYTYVSVDQGGLYLGLEQFAYTETDDQDETWKITRADTYIQDLTPLPAIEQGKSVDLSGSKPKVKYQGTGGRTESYPNVPSGTLTVTDQFDFTYTVTLLNGNPVTADDYTLDADGKTFTPKSTGTFTIEVSAKYKAGTPDHFKADLKEPEPVTFTVGGELGEFTGIKVDANREATYGVHEDDKTWYDTTDNGTSKYISLEGITVTEIWSNGNQTYDLSILQPENIDSISNGGVAEKVGGILKIKFPSATLSNNATTITFNVKATHPAKNGPGGTGDVTQISKPAEGRVTLKLNARAVNYMTGTDKPVEDGRTYASKVWNGKNDAPQGWIRIKTPETELNEGVLPKDTVSVNGNVVLNGTAVSAEGQLDTQWKIQPTNAGTYNQRNGLTGADAVFYRWGNTPVQGTMNISPAHVNLIQITIDGVERSQPVTGATATITRNDQPNSGSATTGRGLSQVGDIEWKIWDRTANEGAGDWVDVTTPNFQVDSLYRATVKVQADTNHYLKDNTASRIYSIEGKIDGESISEEQPDRTRVSVTVEETPVHDPFGIYNNIATFVAYYDTTETPELQFSDRVGSSSTDHHTPATSVVHVESATVGASLGSYTINLGSGIKDVLDVSVSTTNNELIKEGATLTPTTATTRPVMRPGVAEDQISYTLDLSKVDTSQPGSYTLMLTARGSSSEENLAGGVYNVSGTYAFVLVISERQVIDRPTGGGGGTTTIIYPVVKYWVSDNGYTDDLTAERMTKTKGGKPSFVPKITPMPGLKFLGWAEEDPTTLKEGKLPTLVDPLTFTIDEDKIFYAVYERVDIGHSHYVIGFPDGTFGPDSSITRGQVATIIARSCLEDFVEGGSYGNPGNYTDVDSHWANSAIAYCSMKGVFTGYEDGTFRPDRYISRQELATVVARLAGVEINEGLPFSDAEDISSWALNGIYTNYVNGWVNGYTDGTFKPLNNITRAETVKIFNGYLGRGVDREGLSELREYVHTGTASNIQDGTDEYMTWPDVAKSHWAYYEIIEAANDHNFRWRDTTKAAPPEDWYEAFIDATWRYVDDANDGADDVGRDELPVFTVTYVVKSNGVTWDSVTEQVTKFSSPDPAKLPKAEPSEGYRFAGWSDVDPDTGEFNLVDPTASAVLEDKTFYAIFETKLLITYVVGEHGSTDMALSERINKGESPTTTNLPKITAHEGWSFAGWSETDPATGVVTLTDPTDHPAYADATFYATYEREGEYTMPQVTVTYVLGDRGESDGALVQTFDQYESPRPELLPKVTAREGWEFLGWSETDPANGDYVLTDPTAQSILADKSFYAVYRSQEPAPTEPKDPTVEPGGEPPLPVEDPPAVEPADPLPPVEEEPTQTPEETPEPPAESHEPSEPLPPVEDLPLEYARKRYINGYTDNTFRPDDAFTRAAVATVLANLTGYDPEADYGVTTFTDLEVNGEDHWATNAITFCVSEGLMSGYTDGSFRPDNPISRQEFAVVLTRLTGETESGDLPFADADAIAPWAADSVYTVYAQGWISGYEDGTFLPERNVTRAEAVKMLNRYLDRPADRELIESQSGYTVWADVPETHWAYYEIIEASNDWLE